MARREDRVRTLAQLSVVIHIFAAIALVGSIGFNTVVLVPALKRIPPAHSAVISEKIGAGLMWVGLASLALLGVSGVTLLWSYGLLAQLLRVDFWTSAYGWRLALMVGGWVALVVTGTLSAVWYRTVLTQKLPFTAGLRDLEERRAAQERVSSWQERLAYLNLGLGLLTVLGGALLRALR